MKIAMSEMDDVKICKITDDMRKPDSIIKYRTWLQKKHNIRVESKEKNYYQSISLSAKRDFEKTKFWTNLNERIEEYNQEYFSKTGYYLVSPTLKAIVLVKPFLFTSITSP